jgi:hypothetical protein
MTLRKFTSFASAVSAINTKGKTDAEARPLQDFKPGDSVLIHFEQRNNKLHSHYRGPYAVVSVDPVNPNFFIVGERDPDGSIFKTNYPASRLRPFNAKRYDSATSEIRREGPDHFVVEAIVGHFPQEDFPRVRLLRQVARPRRHLAR